MNPQKRQFSVSTPNLTDSKNENELSAGTRHFSMSQSHFRRHSGGTPLQKPAPFKMRWINGFNSKVGVRNLNDKGSTTLFYAASNCGVLYNWTTHHMWILQGHRHMVTCIATDARGKWLVTADCGPENVIIIWDSTDFFPQKTIFSPHGSTRLAKVAISSDARYLLSLAYPADKAALYWWIWSFGQNTPHAIKEIDDMSRDSVVRMGFSPTRSKQFLLMTRTSIYVGMSRKIVVVERGLVKETDNWEIILRNLDKVNPDYGKLMCYTFVRSTSQILVATSRGAVMVYGYTIEYQQHVEPSDVDNLRFIKVVKLDKRMINVIKNIDDVIITGNSAGEIHFYDDQLKLLYWVHGFTVDKVKGLSFNISPRSSMILDPKCNKPCPCWEKVELQKDPETGEVKQKLIKMRLPSDATVSGKPFLVRDFIVWTHNQGVGFVDFVTEKYRTIIDSKTSPALSMTVHPEKPLLCVGFTDGTVELINFVQHKLFDRLDLRKQYTVIIPPNDDQISCNFEITVPELSVTCLKYSPSGLHLACGLNTGQILFLDPTTVEILEPSPFQDTSFAIHFMSFSIDSLTLATADSGRTVCVYKYKCDKFQWVFIGKHRAHYKDITAVLFLPIKDMKGEFPLVSIGMDRCLVEYNIGASSEEYLDILSLDRVEQSAVPLCGIVWPTPENLDPEQYRTDLPTILIANDEHKYKIINNATTMTLATVLGPRYDYPVNKMQLITGLDYEEKGQYLLFAAREIIGLQKMPLDGNPWKHVGLLGHPNRILQMCFREDLGTLFTIGLRDTTITQWAANYRSVDSASSRSGIELDPYYCLVDDGRPGWLFQEIRDLFYYIQILCQGTFSPARRRVKDYIPIDSLPDLMRALGFFPSEYEVENLIIEAKYNVYLRNPVTEINFEEFVKLYLNHRPALGENFKRIRSGFRNFANISNEGAVLSREDFIEMLTTNVKENIVRKPARLRDTSRRHVKPSQRPMGGINSDTRLATNHTKKKEDLSYEQISEHFSLELCWYLLTILCGHSFEDRAVMNEEDFSFLPEYITFTHFVTEIIGIQEMDNVSDQYSGVVSWASLYSENSDDSDD